MKIKIFAIPFDPHTETFDTHAISEFAERHQIVSEKSELFQLNGRHYVAIVVEYNDLPNTATKPATRPAPAARPEPAAHPETRRANGNGQGSAQADFPPPEFSTAEAEMFEAMRRWRLNRARDMDIKPYLICSNRELADIVSRRPGNASELGAIKGMSQVKVDQHGRELLAELQRLGAGRSSAQRQTRR